MIKLIPEELHEQVSEVEEEERDIWKHKNRMIYNNSLETSMLMGEWITVMAEIFNHTKLSA